MPHKQILKTISLIILSCLNFTIAAGPASGEEANQSLGPILMRFSLDFENFPSTEVYTPPSKSELKFKTETEKRYRSILEEELKRDPNFNRSYSIKLVGCGTNCAHAFLINRNTNLVETFPRGPETNLELQLFFRTDSRLILSHWVDRQNVYKSTNRRCHWEAFEKMDGKLKLLNQFSSIEKSICSFLTQ